jgi:serine-type D-Ala-D-Ala carboxypeptidase/endopeptidase
MKRVAAISLAVALVVIVVSRFADVRVDAAPGDDEIRRILIERIDVARQGVGIVVGVIDPSGRRVVSYGHLAKDDKRPLNGDTVFEIGSITKVFTSLLLADMARHGEIGLTDRLAQHLPYEMNVPVRNERAITLQDLATHTSGLPRMPANFVPKDAANPYADYNQELLRQFLSGYALSRDIGSVYEYSNIGAGMLGFALTRKAGRGMDYEMLVRDRITAPRLLDMPDTRVTLTDSMKARLATGHNALLWPVANWDFPPATCMFVGAGGLRSTVNDLLKFLAANLGLTETPLAPAMASMIANPRPTGRPNVAIGLGWHITTSPGSRQIVWHNGGTGGYRSFIGFDQKARIGVVVLSNTNTQTGVDDIGMHLIDSTMPLTVTKTAPPPPPPPTTPR